MWFVENIVKSTVAIPRELVCEAWLDTTTSSNSGHLALGAFSLWPHSWAYMGQRHQLYHPGIWAVQERLSNVAACQLLASRGSAALWVAAKKAPNYKEPPSPMAVVDPAVRGPSTRGHGTPASWSHHGTGCLLAPPSSWDKEEGASAGCPLPYPGVSWSKLEQQGTARPGHRCSAHPWPHVTVWGHISTDFTRSTAGVNSRNLFSLFERSQRWTEQEHLSKQEHLWENRFPLRLQSRQEWVDLSVGSRVATWYADRQEYTSYVYKDMRLFSLLTPVLFAPFKWSICSKG